ncbi:MAG: hypothetical protein E6Q59_00915, partial [Nitrosomonas sp.]
MTNSLSAKVVESNLRVLAKQPDRLVANAKGQLYSANSGWGRYLRLVNGFLGANERRRQKAIKLTCEALEAAPPSMDLIKCLESIDVTSMPAEVRQAASMVRQSEEQPTQQEELIDKDVIIETLQAQLEQLQSISPVNAVVTATPESIPPAPAKQELAPVPNFVVEEEHARLTAAIAQQIKKIEGLISQIEKSEGPSSETLPPPLSLARELGLASTGRTARPSDDENLFHLQELHKRLLALQEVWNQKSDEILQLQEQMRSGAPLKGSKQGWIELDEAEVRELENSLGRLQLRNEQLIAENERLKTELDNLK